MLETTHECRVPTLLCALQELPALLEWVRGLSGSAQHPVELQIKLLNRNMVLEFESNPIVAIVREYISATVTEV